MEGNNVKVIWEVKVFKMKNVQNEKVFKMKSFKNLKT